MKPLAYYISAAFYAAVAMTLIVGSYIHTRNVDCMATFAINNPQAPDVEALRYCKGGHAARRVP